MSAGNGWAATLLQRLLLPLLLKNPTIFNPGEVREDEAKWLASAPRWEEGVENPELEKELFEENRDNTGINSDNVTNIDVTVRGGDVSERWHSFDDFGLHPILRKIIELLKYKSPTPIQKFSIPILLEGRDLMASAQTDLCNILEDAEIPEILREYAPKPEKKKAVDELKGQDVEGELPPGYNPSGTKPAEGGDVWGSGANDAWGASEQGTANGGA
ncbi:hypothetical protein HK104_010182, partial [Borealophlyctis nickersoniae]